MENSKNKTGWQKHLSPKNILINGLIAFIPLCLIVGILRELRLGGALIIGSVILGSIYLTGEIREKIKRRSASLKEKSQLEDSKNRE